MAIQAHGDTGGAPTGGADTTAAGGFGGANLSGGAPQGGIDWLNLYSRLNIGRFDPSIEPYLEKVMEILKKNLTNVVLDTLERLPNTYAVRYETGDGVLNYFGLQFFMQGTPNDPQFRPASLKLRPMLEELKRSNPNAQVRLVDARVIIAGYEPDMERWSQMAETIIRVFRVTSDPVAKNATIQVIKTTEYAASFSLTEARMMERALSPHGVAPRMDIGMTLKARIRNDFGRDFKDTLDEYRPYGVIGGFIEIRSQEEFNINGQTRLLWQPVFNITVCNSVIPLEGSFAILLASIAPTIYNTLFWTEQFSNMAEGKPNLGSLEMDPDNKGRTHFLKDKQDILDFVTNRIARPIIALQLLDGFDSIPGTFRMADPKPEVKSHFTHRLANFFDTTEDGISNIEISRIAETRIDGVYGAMNGTLKDSREIDYLSIVAMLGIGAVTPDMQRVFLNGSDNPSERATIVSEVSNRAFVPLYLDTTALINPDFITWIGNKTQAAGLVIVDPNSRVQARPIGSFMAGFGQSANVNSIVTNGAMGRGGFRMDSVWA